MSTNLTKPVLLKSPEVISEKLEALKPGKLVHVKIPKALRIGGYNSPKFKSFFIGMCMGVETIPEKAFRAFGLYQNPVGSKILYVLAGNTALAFQYVSDFRKVAGTDKYATKKKTKTVTTTLVRIMAPDMFRGLNKNSGNLLAAAVPMFE